MKERRRHFQGEMEGKTEGEQSANQSLVYLQQSGHLVLNPNQ